MPNPTAALALVAAITCCVVQSAGDRGAAKVDAPALDQFVDGLWVLRIDRAVPRENLGLSRHTDQVDESE